MHSEEYSISESVANAINQHRKQSTKNKILTVGTTTTRVLEAVASPSLNSLDYEIKSGDGSTNIFIYPPYQYKMVDALLTNFHMPGLTPIM